MSELNFWVVMFFAFLMAITGNGFIADSKIWDDRLSRILAFILPPMAMLVLPVLSENDRLIHSIWALAYMLGALIALDCRLKRSPP